MTSRKLNNATMNERNNPNKRKTKINETTSNGTATAMIHL